MTTHRRTILAAVLAAAVLAACSGGAGTGGVTPNASAAVHKTFAWHGALGKLKIRIAVPSKKEARRIAKLVARAAAKTPPSRRKPHYLPQSATTVCFSLISVNGAPTRDDGLCDTPDSFDFALDTSDASACTAISDPTTPSYACTAIEPAPVGEDQWTIVATDSHGASLSESNVTIDVLLREESSANFSLNPVATGISLTGGTHSAADPLVPIASPFPNGGSTPTWNGSGYSCASQDGCYDPILNNDGVALADTIQLNVTDADGNTIIPTAQGQSVSGAPNVPIYINGATGNEAEASTYCGDPDVLLASATAPDAVPISFASMIARGYTDNPDVANGSLGGWTSGGVPQRFSGPGNDIHWSGIGELQALNSPVTGQDTATSGQGTDANGNPIADGLYGNNVAYINYDGGGNTGGPYGLGVINCYVYLGDAGTLTTYAFAQYHLGLAQGDISWGADARHAGSRDERTTAGSNAR